MLIIKYKHTSVAAGPELVETGPTADSRSLLNQLLERIDHGDHLVNTVGVLGNRQYYPNKKTVK